MAGLDLTGVRAVLGDWLEATRLVVLRDNGAADDELDPETGRLVPAAATLLYDGPGAVLPVVADTGMADFDTTTRPADSETTHRVLLPLDSPAGLAVGNQIVVRAIDPTSGDPALVGRWFELTEVPSTGTFSVLRIAFAKPSVGLPGEGP